MRHGSHAGSVKAGYHYFEVGERDLAAGIYLTSVGWGGVARGGAYPAAGHPEDYDFAWSRGRVLTDMALVFIASGRGEFETREGMITWSPGHAVLLPPGLWHRYRPQREHGWTEYWLTMSGELVGRLWQQWTGGLPVRPLPLCRPVVFRREFERFIAKVMREAGKPVGGGRPQPLTWTAAGLGLLGSFVEEHLEDRPGLPGGDDLEKALRFLQGHAHRPLGVNQIAAAAGVTRRTLERRFAESIGRSPRDHLEWLRVQRARKLLVETRRPVKEIAFLCGFRESRGLIRACRRWLDRAPGTIRADGRGGLG